MRVIALTRDLMDGGRLRSALPGIVVVRQIDADELADAELVVVDLAGGFDLGAVVAASSRVVAYGAHVDTEALDAAVAAGCEQALPRSRVFRWLAEQDPAG